MSSVYLGRDVFMDGISLITRDDGNCFIEVADPSPPWYEENDWAYHIEIPIDLGEAKKVWLDFNYRHFKKNCCCTMNPCSHSLPSYDSDSES